MNASSSFDPRHPLKSLTIPRDALRPPSSDNPRVGALMSVLAHAGLVAALALGVQWRNVEPEGVSAELWAAVPEIAAPRAEPPPEAAEPAPPPPKVAMPPPDTAERDAQIAVEQSRKQRLEKERKDAEEQRAREKRQQEELQREKERDAKAQADKERLAQQKSEAAREKARQDQLRRMNEQLGGTGGPTSTGTAARDAGPSSSYAGRIVARIRPNIQLPFEVAGNPTTEVELRVAADGTILSQRVVKPSGIKEWDDAVLRAVEKTAVLPRDDNGRVPSPMTLSVSRYPRT